MTRQIGEVVIYLNQSYRTQRQPLSGYLHKLPAMPKRSLSITGNWRGYVGTWEVRNDKLFLIGLTTQLGIGLDLELFGLDCTEEEPVGLDYFFPGHSEVFAKWFSGEIGLEVGNAHFQWTYDEYIYLGFKKGKLIYTRNVKTDFAKLKEREDEYKDFWEGFKPRDEY